MKYKVVSKTETSDITIGADQLDYAEWIAKAMLADFGNAEILETEKS